MNSIDSLDSDKKNTPFLSSSKTSASFDIDLLCVKITSWVPVAIPNWVAAVIPSWVDGVVSNWLARVILSWATAAISSWICSWFY